MGKEVKKKERLGGDKFFKKNSKRNVPFYEEEMCLLQPVFLFFQPFFGFFRLFRPFFGNPQPSPRVALGRIEQIGEHISQAHHFHETRGG